MIIGVHIVVASKDAEADQRFFREVLGLRDVDAGEGYLIFGLPQAEASIHSTTGSVPQHELFFLCDDVEKFAKDMDERNIEHGEINDQGWGLVMELTLPSGAPLNVYQPRHARP